MRKLRVTKAEQYVHVLSKEPEYVKFQQMIVREKVDVDTFNKLITNMPIINILKHDYEVIGFICKRKGGDD